MSTTRWQRLLSWLRVLAHFAVWAALLAIVDYRDSYLPYLMDDPEHVRQVGRYMDGAVMLVIATDAFRLFGSWRVARDLVVAGSLVLLVALRYTVLLPIIVDETYRELVAELLIIWALGGALVWVIYSALVGNGLVQVRLRYFLAAMAVATVLVVVNFRRGALLEPLLPDEASRRLLSNAAFLIAVLGVLGGVGLAGGQARRLLLHALAWLIILGLVVNFDPLLARWGVDPAWRSTLNGWTATFALAGAAGYLTYWVGATLDALPAALARRRAEQATPTK